MFCTTGQNLVSWAISSFTTASTRRGAAGAFGAGKNSACGTFEVVRVDIGLASSLKGRDAVPSVGRPRPEAGRFPRRAGTLRTTDRDDKGNPRPSGYRHK